MPLRGSKNAAGYDLFAAEEVRVPGSTMRPHDSVHVGNAVVPTGLAFEIPHGFYGRIVERSGLAFRQHDEGHTPAPNWSWFLDFAAKQFKAPTRTASR